MDSSQQRTKGLSQNHVDDCDLRGDLHRERGFRIGNKIVVMQSCDHDFEEFLDVAGPVNETFCRKHAYQYSAFVGTGSGVPGTATFNRYYMLRDAIAEGVYDWALWLDADALVIDQQRRLESIIEPNQQYAVVACTAHAESDFRPLPYNVNTGVVFFNLRRDVIGELVELCIDVCENTEKYRDKILGDIAVLRWYKIGDESWLSDQNIVQAWLRHKSQQFTEPFLVRTYYGEQRNEFNYDGPFIYHVHRARGDRATRLRILSSMREKAQSA